MLLGGEEARFKVGIGAQGSCDVYKGQICHLLSSILL